MHLHVLGICGTFMGGLALLAQAAGHKVTGCDANVYPPMSDQLRAAGIDLIEGFDAAQLESRPDLFVIGNVVTRGNPLMEAILDAGAPFSSGPQWLGENLLRGRWVLAVAGTHGKTTTSAMLAAILEHAGLAPGFLIGGVPEDFGFSARVGATDFFVIEADEYDTAFFDKRSKFVHYFPRTVVLNNLEFDHADIFPDLAAIETQFHHLVRCVPRNGRVVSNGERRGARARTRARLLGAGRAFRRRRGLGGCRGGRGHHARIRRAVRRRTLRSARTAHGRGAQPQQCAGRDRRRASRRRAAGRRDRGAGALPGCQATPRGARPARRRHGLRRLCAPSDRDRHDR